MTRVYSRSEMERNNSTVSNKREAHSLKEECDRFRRELKAQIHLETKSYTLKMHVGKN